MGFITGVFKFFGWVIASLVVVVVLALIASRFTDGPTAILAGGEFTSGTLAAEEPDWSFAKDLDTVEFQLLDPARSRTTWITVVDGRVFIPCGYMNSTWGRIWKQWPIQAEKNGEAILRIDGKLYNRTLKRVKDDPALDGVLSELARKYLSGAGDPNAVAFGRETIDSNSLWIFELVPRA